MENTKIDFEVKSLKKLENPVSDTGNLYYSLVDIRLLPKELKNWRQTNVRDPNLTKRVAKDISESLAVSPKDFHVKNRGIVINAKSLEFDNKLGRVSLLMEDPEIHGITDGGHTYEVIQQALDSMDEETFKDLEAYVRLEIMVDVRDRDLAIDITEARNNSMQVDMSAFQELKHEFDTIKEVLKYEPYADNIAYKQWEWKEDGSFKEIPVTDLLSILMCFDKDTFSEDRHPTEAAGQRVKVTRMFIASKKTGIIKYIKLLPDFLKLYDIIYATLPDAYNKHGYYASLSLGKKATLPLRFIGKEAEQFVPKGFILPILAAFRSLLVVKGNRVKWSRDPVTFWKVIKDKVGLEIYETAKRMDRPVYMVKDRATWANLYRLFELEATKM